MKFLSSSKKPAIKKTLLSGIAGTTTMTIYSYFASRKEGKQFREPQLLNRLLYGEEHGKMGPVEKSIQPAAGFLLHYCTGILFSSCYHLFWKKKAKTSALKNGISYGLTFGILGISIWKIVFKIHRNPPEIDLSRYLKQLIIAHLIFGITVVFSYEADKQMKK